LREALRDAWGYAQLESRHLRRPSDPVAYVKGIVLRPGAKVVYRTLVDEGWRDGWQGMLKIFLDASSDALVWVRVLFGITQSSTVEAEQPPPEDTGDRHFGRRPAGPPKVVALAGRGAAARRARRWLSELQAAGADVTLVSDDAGPGDAIPMRPTPSLRPFATMRALDAEMQLRTIHAVVPFGRRARLVWHLLPGTLRPRIAGLDADSDPVQVIHLDETRR
jgi:hypothetical protein